MKNYFFKPELENLSQGARLKFVREHRNFFKNNSGSTISDSSKLCTGYGIDMVLSSKTISYALLVKGDVLGKGVATGARLIQHDAVALDGRPCQRHDEVHLLS